MPYKSEKIIIANTEYDRRIKLSTEQKEEVKKLYKEGFSSRQLGKQFGVSKSLILLIVNPHIAERNKQHIKEHCMEYYYRTSKKVISKYKREARRYKQKLYLEGKIK